jgi:hypothetical protein
MRFGCWGSSLTTCYPDAYTFTLYPYAHRNIIDAVLRLPWQYRGSGRMPKDLITARWPELLGFGINTPPLGVKARRIARHAVRVVRRGVRRAVPRGSGWS